MQLSSAELGTSRHSSFLCKSHQLSWGLPWWSGLLHLRFTQAGVLSGCSTLFGSGCWSWTAHRGLDKYISGLFPLTLLQDSFFVFQQARGLQCVHCTLRCMYPFFSDNYIVGAIAVVTSLCTRYRSRFFKFYLEPLAPSGKPQPRASPDSATCWTARTFASTAQTHVGQPGQAGIAHRIHGARGLAVGYNPIYP
jgi:hypothetical protein